MVRFVLVLLMAGALWFGYDVYASAASSDGKPTDDVGAEVSDEPLAGTSAAVREDRAQRPTGGALAAPSRPAAPRVDPDVARIVQGLATKNLKDAAAVFPALLKARGSDRERLVAAVAEFANDATPAALLAVLGESNAFLHCEEGRSLARDLAALAARLKAEEAIHTFTALLEVCMRGPIAKADVEPRSVVDLVYATMQPALRRTVLNPSNVARARTYKVRPGDALDRIARRYRQEGLPVEAGTIAAFNRISDPRRLRAGQVVKVPVDPIRTVVEKSSFLQAVYVGDVIFRIYWVGHGKDDCTPEATFRIGARQEHPDWYADGRVIPYGHPENVLGDYFVKFVHDSFTGFGAHGTSHPESIGTMASAGCIRMHDKDIEDYFKIIPRGSAVEIRTRL